MMRFENIMKNSFGMFHTAFYEGKVKYWRVKNYFTLEGNISLTRDIFSKKRETFHVLFNP